MPANNESSALDFDDDLPDFSTPEWLEKFDRAPVVYGNPAKPSGRPITSPGVYSPTSPKPGEASRVAAARKPLPPI